MLVALSAANFTVTSSGSATAPFLQQIADDLGTTLPAVAHLFAVQAITWGTAALVAGTFALRLGRRSVLVASVLLLAATRVGFVLSPNYARRLPGNSCRGSAAERSWGPCSPPSRTMYPPAHAGAL
jgi:predicted MFS family arabinose efflux permease